jgi:hypothetical protein
VIAKHPPEYYIDGLQIYIRGANLVEKASTLVGETNRSICLTTVVQLEKETTD